MANAQVAPLFKFEAVPSTFVDYSKVTPMPITTQSSFGILDAASFTGAVAGLDASEHGDKKPWERLTVHVGDLNQQSPAETIYKVVFLTRHGRGYHNDGEARFGTQAWDDHWSKLEGDGQGVVWADSKLDPTGIQQVTALGEFWLDAVASDRVPIPQTLYTSPLQRCLETSRRVFGPTFAAHELPFRPTVKELLRERLTDHTCDRRSTRSWITDTYPDYVVEPGFSEKDELWTGNGGWESEDAHIARKQRVLDDIFSTDDNAVISLTIHTMAIKAICAVIGLPPLRVREGTTVAVLVKAERLA